MESVMQVLELLQGEELLRGCLQNYHVSLFPD
jgi:hypothetical protein